MEAIVTPIKIDARDLRQTIELAERLRDLLTEIRGLLREISPAPSITAEEFATQVASLFGNLPPLTNLNNLEDLK